MIYPIVKFGNPILEKPSAKVTVFDEELKTLIDDMFESMYAAKGVGLAAPQIGFSRKITVIAATTSPSTARSPTSGPGAWLR